MGGYDNRYIICEDSELWMRAFAKGKKFYILEEKLITRTVHKDSITETYWGNPIAITNVIRIKLNYLITKGLLLNKKIGIIGKNSRNNYVLQLFKEIGIENFEYSITCTSKGNIFFGIFPFSNSVTISSTSQIVLTGSTSEVCISKLSNT